MHHFWVFDILCCCDIFMYLPWQGASGKVLIIIQACYLPMLTVVRIACCLVLDFNANEFISSNKRSAIQLRCVLNQFY